MQIEVGSEIVAGAIAALGGLAVWFRRERGAWAKTNADVVGNEAKGDVIDLMRSELARLHTSSTDLARELTSSQISSANLHSEVVKLRAEREALHGEIADLRQQITELTQLIQDQVVRCEDCPGRFIKAQDEEEGRGA